MRRNYFLWAIALLMASCNAGNTSDTSKPASSSSQKNSASNAISFKVDGVQVNSEGWNISQFTKGDNSIGLNITSNMHLDPHTINVNLSSARKGTYAFGSGLGKESYGHYYPDYKGNMFDSYEFVDGSFTITEVDTVKNVVNGNFEGSVKNNDGKTFRLTDGRIVNGRLTKLVSN